LQQQQQQQQPGGGSQIDLSKLDIGGKRPAAAAGLGQDDAIGGGDEGQVGCAGDGSPLDYGTGHSFLGTGNGAGSGPPAGLSTNFDNILGNVLGSQDESRTEISINEIKALMQQQNELLLGNTQVLMTNALGVFRDGMQQLLNEHTNNQEQRLMQALQGGQSGLSPAHYHDLESLKLANQQEASKTLLLYGFDKDDSMLTRHIKVKTLLADWDKLNEHDYQPENYKADNPGYNVINARAKVTSYVLKFKSVGARKAAATFILNKKEEVKGRTRAPIYQETIDQTLITVRNNAPEQGMRIDFSNKQISNAGGQCYGGWDWDNAGVYTSDGSICLNSPYNPNAMNGA